MNPPKEVGLLRKLVSTARSVVTKQVALPIGMLRFKRNLFWLSNCGIKPLTFAEQAAVTSFMRKISDFPLEQERNYWAPDKLRELDANLESIVAANRLEMLEILERIIENYG